MKGRPQEYMDVGLIHFMAFPEVMRGEGPVVDTLNTICRDDYFQAVEVTRIRDAGERKHAIELAAGTHTRVGFAAQPVLLGGKYDLNSLDPAAHQEAIDVARTCLEEANEWGACGLALLSGEDPGTEQRPTATVMLIASLKETCERSRRLSKMPVILETFDRVPYGKNRLVGPTSEASKIADKVYPYYFYFGLCIDLSHLPLLGETAEYALKTATPYLRLVHIGNCVMKDENHPAYGDEHPVFNTPGGENGVDELAAFLQALLEVDYLGKGLHNIVSIEVTPYGEQTSESVIAESKAALDAAWAAL